MFWGAGILCLAPTLLELLVEAIFDTQFNIQISEGPIRIEYIGSGFIILGFILYLLDRHDEKTKSANNTTSIAQNPSQTSNVTPPAEFQKLRIGNPRELVGREEALGWLEERLIERPTNRVAVASVGAGGIGKTFLAHAFAELHKEQQNIVEMTVGDRPALQVGIEFLEKNRVDVSNIRNTEELRVELDDFYDQTEGILLVDDVWNDDVQDILPTTQNWKALITTRDKGLAKKFTNEVLSLNVFSPEQSMELFHKVLGEAFQSEQNEAYQELAYWLGHRPYGIRLAAESLKESLLTPDPASLLKKLQSEGLQAPRPGHAEDLEDLHQLHPLLEHCLSQLEEQSSAARELLNALAVCADEGIEVQHFIDWQSTEHSKDQVEHELQVVQNYGLLFVESIEFSMLGDEHKINRLRLHTDILQFLRASSLIEEEVDLWEFLHQALVQSDEPFEPKRTLQLQVNALIQRHQGDVGKLRRLHINFFAHFYRTSQLLWAYDLGQQLLGFAEIRENKSYYQAVLGDQALILRDWGQLEQAMKLRKQEEKIALELEDKAGISRCYSNQALILMDWGQLEQAMELQRKQEKLCEELDDKAGLQMSYRNQALILRAWGILGQAMELLQKQEKLCEKLSDKHGLQTSYGNQALILGAWGQLEKAMELHQKEEKLCEELGNKAGLQTSYGNQALILQTRRQLEQAMELLHRQEKLCEELSDRDGLQRSYGNQALILRDWEQLEQAMNLHQKQEKLCKELGNKVGLMTSYGNQAVILHDWKQLEQAMELHQKEEKLALESSDKAGLWRCYWNMGVLLKEMERHHEALEKMKAALVLMEELKDPRLEEFTQFVQAYEAEVRGKE